MALYWAFRLSAWVLRVMPLRGSYALARLGGLAAFYLWPGGRRRCVANMLHVTAGDPALAHRYARRSFGYYALYLVDFLRFGVLTPADLRRRVEFDDWPLIEGARAGNGIVFVTMHFGNWDLAAARLADHGLPLSVVADTFDHAGLDRLVVGARERLGMSIVPAGRVGPGILRALRHNDIVALLIDVPRRESAVNVEFFGATVAVPDGPARLALRAGAPVFVAMIPRLGPASDCFAAVVEPVPFAATGDRERDARALTQETMRALERTVRRHPDQWYIFRSLWLEDGAAGEAG